MGGVRTKRFTLNFSGEPLNIREVLGASFVAFESCKHDSWKPTNFIGNRWSPIVDARVRFCSKSYDEDILVVNDRVQPNEKPVYVFAQIEPEHLANIGKKCCF